MCNQFQIYLIACRVSSFLFLDLFVICFKTLAPDVVVPSASNNVQFCIYYKNNPGLSCRLKEIELYKLLQNALWHVQVAEGKEPRHIPTMLPSAGVSSHREQLPIGFKIAIIYENKYI